MDAPLGTNDEFSVGTTELAECAQMNFRSVVKMNPSLGQHSIFMLAMKQLDAVVARMIADDEAEEPVIPKSQRL